MLYLLPMAKRIKFKGDQDPSKNRQEVIGLLLQRVNGGMKELEERIRGFNERIKTLSPKNPNERKNIGALTLSRELVEAELRGVREAENILTKGVQSTGAPPFRSTLLKIYPGSGPDRIDSGQFRFRDHKEEDTNPAYSDEALRAQAAFQTLSHLYEMPGRVRGKFSPEGQMQILSKLQKAGEEERFGTDVPGVQVVFRRMQETSGKGIMEDKYDVSEIMVEAMNPTR